MFNQKISRMFEKHFLKKIDHASSEHAESNSAADTHTPGRYPLSVGQ